MRRLTGGGPRAGRFQCASSVADARCCSRARDCLRIGRQPARNIGSPTQRSLYLRPCRIRGPHPGAGRGGFGRDDGKRRNRWVLPSPRTLSAIVTVWSPSPSPCGVRLSATWTTRLSPSPLRPRMGASGKLTSGAVSSGAPGRPRSRGQRPDRRSPRGANCAAESVRYSAPARYSANGAAPKS